jgi:hypothetical protein
MGINILLLIWSASARPYLNQFNNKMEINTEMFLAIIAYHLLCFTDWVPEDAKSFGIMTRVMMGYSFICWVAILVAVNLYFILGEILKITKWKMIVKYRKFLLKHFPEKFKIHQEQRFAEFKKTHDEYKVTLELRDLKK